MNQDSERKWDQFEADHARQTRILRAVRYLIDINDNPRRPAAIGETGHPPFKGHPMRVLGMAPMYMDFDEAKEAFDIFAQSRPDWQKRVVIA
jgi:hypothetical protein